MEPIIDSVIENLKFKDTLITFRFITHLTYIGEPTEFNYEFQNRRRPRPLTEEIKDYTKVSILTPINVANEFRISLLNDVPSLGVYDVIITKNTTFLTDDLLESRIILVQIKLVDPELIWEMYNTKSCKCEGEEACYFCEIIGTLDVTAPEDDFDLLTDYITFSDARIEAIPRLPIMKLAKGHSIKATIKINKGVGEEFKRYSSVDIVGFKSISQDTIDFKVELNQKLPPLFVLYFAINALNNKFKDFNYKIKNAFLSKDKDENIVIEKE
jgi:hypothetical protein